MLGETGDFGEDESTGEQTGSNYYVDTVNNAVTSYMDFSSGGELF